MPPLTLTPTPRSSSLYLWDKRLAPNTQTLRAALSKSLWLRRVWHELQQAPAAIVHDPGQWGLLEAFEILAKEGSLAWIKLSELTSGSIGCGNALAEALYIHTKQPLFGYGLHYKYGLEVFKHARQEMAISALGLSGAEHNLEFVREMLGLALDLPIMLMTADPNLPMTASDLPWVSPDFLALQPQEASKLIEDVFPKGQQLAASEVLALLEQSEGRLGHFWELVAYNIQGETKLTLTPEKQLQSFELQKQWVEAFAYAVQQLPDQAERVLREAGHAYHEQGLHRELFDLISLLPHQLQQNDTVMYWKLVSAVRLNVKSEVREQLELFLEKNEAPETRAYYAMIFYVEDRLTQTERAHKYRKTPNTMFMLAAALGEKDPSQQESISLLHKAIEVAEKTDRKHQIILCISRLVSTLSYVGSYQESLYWAEYGKSLFEKSGVLDIQRYIGFINSWSHIRLLSGNLEGTFDLMNTLYTFLSSTENVWARNYRSTMADYLLATGEIDKAIHLYQENVDSSPRTEVGWDANNLVRALVEASDFQKALQVGKQAFFIAKRDSHSFRENAVLAYGIALSFANPQESIQYLEEALEAFFRPIRGHHIIQAAFYLAHAYSLLNDTARAKLIIAKAIPFIKEISPIGLLSLVGPSSEFQSIWPLIPIEHLRNSLIKSPMIGAQPPKDTSNTIIPTVEMIFLGGSGIFVNGIQVKMPLKFTEILIILAANQGGLSSEQLLVDLYPDSNTVQKSTLKSVISRIRANIPINSQPYKINCSFSADFLQLPQLIRLGRIEQALSLYQGPLLPESEAPGVIEMREVLDEQIRQAVLDSNNPDFILKLASQIPDDAELWETALKYLPQNDARASEARARIKRQL
jgi:tetratricopeptide (TPR) repeat protein